MHASFKYTLRGVQGLPTSSTSSDMSSSESSSKSPVDPWPPPGKRWPLPPLANPRPPPNPPPPPSPTPNLLPLTPKLLPRPNRPPPPPITNAVCPLAAVKMPKGTDVPRIPIAPIALNLAEPRTPQGDAVSGQQADRSTCMGHLCSCSTCSNLLSTTRHNCTTSRPIQKKNSCSGTRPHNQCVSRWYGCCQLASVSKERQEHRTCPLC